MLVKIFMWRLLLLFRGPQFVQLLFDALKFAHHGNDMVQAGHPAAQIVQDVAVTGFSFQQAADSSRLNAGQYTQLHKIALEFLFRVIHIGRFQHFDAIEFLLQRFKVIRFRVEIPYVIVLPL